MTTSRTFQSFAFVLSAAAMVGAMVLATPAEAQVPRPDLVIGNLRVQPDLFPLFPGNQVKRGKPYLACFVVANIGFAPSGPFRVTGGGLGIPFNPFQNHAGLAPGASRAGCLKYPTTPKPGNYNLVLKVDSLNTVVESNEGNNTAVMVITVVP
jgi:subtilase family serine protease